MTPILIVIPFWQGDITAAIDLCKILAGLQPHHAGNLAHVMLVSRQDCKLDVNMVKIISAKFNTLTFKSTSPKKGWPSGPNGMFSSAMINISLYHAKKYECVYWMEPDAIPLCPNWYWDLVVEWRRRHPTVNVMGCRADCDGNGKGDHISGSCLYHPNITRILPELTRSDSIAWDYQHRARIVAMGAHTNMIENFYKATNLPMDIVDRAKLGVRVIHGAKDASVRNAVKRKYKIT